jgi:hypothetical protein
METPHLQRGAPDFYPSGVLSTAGGILIAVAGQAERPELLVTQEVSFRSEGTRIPAYLARPRESGRYPGVILIHDIFGVSDHARDVARRLANVGFLTLGPIVSRASTSALARLWKTWSTRNEDHEPPHFHARGPDFVAKFAISDLI